MKRLLTIPLDIVLGLCVLLGALVVFCVAPSSSEPPKS